MVVVVVDWIKKLSKCSAGRLQYTSSPQMWVRYAARLLSESTADVNEPLLTTNGRGGSVDGKAENQNERKGAQANGRTQSVSSNSRSFGIQLSDVMSVV
jgi:hypothetical protein